MFTSGKSSFWRIWTYRLKLIVTISYSASIIQLDTEQPCFRGQIISVPLIAFNQPLEKHFGSTFFITRWRCLQPRSFDLFRTWIYYLAISLATRAITCQNVTNPASVWKPNLCCCSTGQLTILVATHFRKKAFNTRQRTEYWYKYKK